MQICRHSQWEGDLHLVTGLELSKCLARPSDESGKVYLLTEHLLAVAKGCGSPSGDYPERLKFLAGLLHDTGKSSRAWQNYINKKNGKGVPHAFAGAMLFAALFADLLEVWKPTRQERRELCYLAVNLTNIIYNHHGRIEDVDGDYPPWTGAFAPSQILFADIPGLLKLVVLYFPELSSLIERYTRAPECLIEKISAIAGLWTKWTNQMISNVEKLLKGGNRYAIGARLCLQIENARLITADRMHAGEIAPDSNNHLTPEEAKVALNNIQRYCVERKNEMTGKARQSILDVRGQWRQKVLDAFEQNRQNNIFSLELPTGYGKTIAALSVSLKAVEAGQSKRIIYVAPYLSILSQAADEIERATSLKVLTHHHLSALQGLVEQDKVEDLLMEGWQAPVVATTFNQLFLALFPYRAQNTIRLSGLKNSFIIVDEPQVINTGAWNTFLAMAEATTAELGTKFLLVTATLPETGGGIFSEVISLGRARPVSTRYQVEYTGEENEDTLSKKILHSYWACGSTAAILNTVRDAVEVYLRVRDGASEGKVYFLSGRMTPLHKRQRINEIRGALRDKENTMVVCTQVLEAGVDLSFKQLFRAIPVIPSLIQAAGRCNRHGEGEKGRLFVFEYLRGGEKKTRQYVYRDGDQREVTDICLNEHKLFDESMSVDLVSRYYRLCFQRNTQQAPLEKILEAARGNFTAPAGLSPFGAYVPQYSVFVPLVFGVLPEEVKLAMRKFGCKDPAEIWDRYSSKGFLSSLEYKEKKQFMGLMQHFIVQVSEKTVLEVGEPVENRSILRLKGESLYSAETGLSFVSADDEKEIWFV